MTPPTVVTESTRRVDSAYGLRVGVPVLVIVARFLMSEPVDTGATIALSLLGLGALVSAVLWVRVRRHPISVVVADDEIRAEPAGDHPELRRLDRSMGNLGFRRVGRRLGTDSTLTGEIGAAQIPLRFVDPADLVAACERHGWPLAD